MYVGRIRRNGSKIAEITMLIPGERGSYQVFATGSLADEAARSIKPEDFIMCYDPRCELRKKRGC